MIETLLRPNLLSKSGRSKIMWNILQNSLHEITYLLLVRSSGDRHWPSSWPSHSCTHEAVIWRGTSACHLYTR